MLWVLNALQRAQADKHQLHLQFFASIGLTSLQVLGLYFPLDDWNFSLDKPNFTLTTAMNMKSLRLCHRCYIKEIQPTLHSFSLYRAPDMN